MNEIWKDISQYKGLYQISNLGNVKTLKRTIKSDSPKHKNGQRTISERILKPWIDNRGYKRIELKNKKYLVHRLVAKQFIPNPKNLPQINHIDSDKTNNRVDNLEWCTNKQNCIHSVKSNTFGASKLKSEHIPIIRYILNNKCMSETEIGKLFGVHRKTINDISTNRTWKHVQKIASKEQTNQWLKENYE